VPQPGAFAVWHAGPEVCDAQSAEDVPDAPPSGNKCHAADFKICREDRLIEQQHQSESAVLYPGLDSQRSSRGNAHPKQAAQRISGAEGNYVVDEYDDKYVPDKADEEVVVHGKQDDHQGNEDDHGPILEGRENLRRKFRELVAEPHPQ